MIRSALPLAVFCAVLTSHAHAQGTPQPKFTKDQELIIAAFELDIPKVTELLKDGANPNATFGRYDKYLFADKWEGSYSSIGSNNWAPLQAVASSHRAPQPKERVNAIAVLEAARRKMNAIDPKLIRDRDARRVAIAKLLIAAKADLDLDDGRGSTALASSVYNRFDDLSLLLIASGAKLDTKTGVYIDGPSNITPLHRATQSPQVLEAMLKRGVRVNVQDTNGRTPLHWAVQADNVASVKLLLQAGADVAIKDNKGRAPNDWAGWYAKYESRNVNAKDIAEQVSEALKPNP